MSGDSGQGVLVVAVERAPGPGTVPATVPHPQVTERIVLVSCRNVNHVPFHAEVSITFNLILYVTRTKVR